MATFQSPGFAHYSLAWSPFLNNTIAVAASANYGLIGNGRLNVLSVDPSLASGLVPQRQFDTQDGLYDLAWSEVHQNQIVTGSGDGSLKLWDITLNDFPISAWHEHTREVFSVDWSNVRKDTFASSSWDGNVKLWRPDHPRSIGTLKAHNGCVYQALFSPHHPDVLATCSSDGTLKIFDLRVAVAGGSSYAPGTLPPGSFETPMALAALTIPASGMEILSLDWNKYQPFTLASGGVDKTVKIWDCRMVKIPPAGAPLIQEPVQEVGGVCEVGLSGHEYAIRKVQWSPHRPDVLASASYDMSCRIWSTIPLPGRGNLLRIYDAHTEFVVGCSWSLYDEGVLASCSWDCRTSVWRV
ncbi:WD40 repeat-like protein [Thelephora terrestris]|uniref:Peroxin-7 n=1 Tax=Thelephora terrestris TaxID=56493 RepID=A0A9P6L1P1_9AGAM|nr:WD40 repeat-like protein [Thelephora terrestris]